MADAGPVLLTGATGFVGGHIARALRADGRATRCLVRRPERATSLSELGCELARGDMTDPASLAAAAEGCDAVVHLVAVIAAPKPEFVRVMEQGTRDLVQAARAAGVRRLVLMSALGTHEGSRDLVPYFHAKWDEEKTVEASGLPYVIFRPSFVFGGDGGILPALLRLARYAPLMPLPGDGRKLLQPIWVDDVAAYFLKALDLDAATNRLFELGGPDRLTWNELWERLRSVQRRRGATIHVPMGLLRPGAALMELLPRPPVTRDMLTMLEADDNVTADDTAVETFGLPLVPLEDQLRRAAGR